jgi:hypothetical protein
MISSCSGADVRLTEDAFYGGLIEDSSNVLSNFGVDV